MQLWRAARRETQAVILKAREIRAFHEFLRRRDVKPGELITI